MGGWAAYLAGSKKVIVAMIDGRGTGNSGDRRYVVVLNLEVKYKFQIKLMKNNYSGNSRYGIG
jgi:hypothetical protein